MKRKRIPQPAAKHSARRPAGTIAACVGRYDWIRETLLAGAPLNCTEIAERLGVVVKTAQRYINRLRAQGYAVEYVEALKGYRIVPPPPRPAGSRADLALREAYYWAVKRHIRAPWVQRAARILKNQTKK